MGTRIRASGENGSPPFAWKIAAADFDDGEALDLSDAIRLLGWLFLGGEPPAPPGECGSDPEGVDLDCRESACP
jgi:hypothetical protein